ncbi:unnamed protein product [Adineta steineri]|uniref:Glucuronosyltransferase n=1 Tax=Adineta steineri TaxID=433720 RepID=A0A813WGA0_9BILA|nr:unnamed protein product [Adineta steineri]CAF1307680.1 unnamed protein product [Adineta steineri]CAF1308753.1 unnamed protein product [Adineta steineri]
MMPYLSLFIVLIFCSLSIENNNHILIIALPTISHMLPSLELAKQLSTHCHVTYPISANKIKELESKGFIPISNVNRTLDIDGNDDLLEFELQDFQIKLNNTTKISPDNRQKLIFNNVINRMGTALNRLFH